MIAVLVGWLLERRYSLRGTAIARALLGAIVVLELVRNAPDRRMAFGAGASWSDPIRDGLDWPGWFGFWLDLPAPAFDALYVVTILAAVATTIGLFTRAACVVTLALWLPLVTGAPMLGSGADTVLRIVLLYLCFADAGRYLSVDARRRAASGRPAGESWVGTLLHNVAVVLIAHQVVMVYVASALFKVESDRWMDGTAVYYPLHVEAFSPWMGEFDWLFGFEPFVFVATWGSMLVQLAFPLLLLHPTTRMLGFVAVTLIHLGIGVFLGIMSFSLAMIAADCVLVSDSTWERTAAGLRRRLRRERISTEQ